MQLTQGTLFVKKIIIIQEKTNNSPSTIPHLFEQRRTYSTTKELQGFYQK